MTARVPERPNGRGGTGVQKPLGVGAAALGRTMGAVARVSRRSMGTPVQTSGRHRIHYAAAEAEVVLLGVPGDGRHHLDLR